MTRPLAGQVALVTGASRGLGRATALELASVGAHVIVTARSTRGHSTVPNLPQTTVDDTADAIRAAGGGATPLRCDHTDPAQVESVVRHIAGQHGRLDLLVNNAWGAHDRAAGGGAVGEVWDEPPEQLRDMLLAGAYSDSLTSLLALKYVMGTQGHGLIVSTTWHTDEPPGWLPYEVSKAAKNRLVYALGHKLQGKGIAVVGVAPGWMRTELMLQHHSEAELAGQTETPHYAARGVVALAADPEVGRHTGRILDVGELADLYGFTDLDGTRPQWYADQRRRRESS
ncbi:NAD(P)-dependent dehydrogenase (short-subunit alcohol dehydrogenase family) [Deinococcus sp. HSC-46F16]|uniref:SDR family NAD(P)-dependent oxidoreductase n=1 Tax=Deinococcus sp. HSC-46F16 TaxID=2910968 RepID=UPI0020A0AF30|nr:NAD(P)-dependent dehydrogenase (short-subunit alcohol dehydrogenase family) [Deinococcus sp. HSC-46F16]